MTSDAGGATGSGGIAETGGATAGGGASGGDYSSASHAKDPIALPCPNAAGEICHDFLAGDNARNVLVRVDEFDPTRSWTSAKLGSGTNSPRTIEIVDSSLAKGGKAVLASVDTGYMELDVVSGEMLHTVGGFSGVTGACRFPDGSTMLVVVSKFTFVDAAGSEIRSIPMPGSGRPYSVWCNPANGDLWLVRGGNLYNVDSATGAALFDIGGDVAVYVDIDDAIYVSDLAYIRELDARGDWLNTVGGHENFPFLSAVSGFEHLPDGHFVIANYMREIADAPADRPHLIELTRDNQFVWKWGGQSAAGQLVSVHVMR
jgi:hypothetical protein